MTERFAATSRVRAGGIPCGAATPRSVSAGGAGPFPIERERRNGLGLGGFFRRPGVLLALGIIDSDSYRRILDADRRGLRSQVARPGWSNARWSAVVRTVAAVVGIIALAVLFVIAASIAGAA